MRACITHHQLGVGPASITLFFRKEDESVSASLPFAAPPTYQDILRQPSLAPSALSTEREVCNVITSELGIAAETVAPVFIHPAGEGTDSVGGGRGWGVGVMGMLVLASNQVLQAQGLYQVSDDDTPPGICRRLCELFSSSSSAAGSMSSHTALSSNLKIRQDLGVLERVEVAVVQTSSSEDAEGSTYPIPSNLQQKLQDLHERAQAAGIHSEKYPLYVPFLYSNSTNPWSGVATPTADAGSSAHARLRALTFESMRQSCHATSCSKTTSTSAMPPQR